jgi:hypothetical protein
VSEDDAPLRRTEPPPVREAESVPQPAIVIPPPDEIKPPPGPPPDPAESVESAAPHVPSIPVPKERRSARPSPPPRQPHSSDVFERVKSSPTFQHAMEAFESVIEAGLEKAAETASVDEVTVEGAIEPVSARPLNPPVFGAMRRLMSAQEPLVGVLDVRGTPEWQTWKYLIGGGVAMLVLGGMLGVGLFNLIGLLALLYVFVQSLRTWRGQIGRYFLGFTPHRVILLPRDADGALGYEDAQSVDWSVVDRLRLTDKYIVIDAVPGGGKGLHFGALVLMQGEGGLGQQPRWLPNSPITALIDDKGFEVRDL